MTSSSITTDVFIVNQSGTSHTSHPPALKIWNLPSRTSCFFGLSESLVNRWCQDYCISLCNLYIYLSYLLFHLLCKWSVSMGFFISFIYNLFSFFLSAGQSIFFSFWSFVFPIFSFCLRYDLYRFLLFFPFFPSFFPRKSNDNLSHTNQ